MGTAASPAAARSPAARRSNHPVVMPPLSSEAGTPALSVLSFRCIGRRECGDGSYVVTLAVADHDRAGHARMHDADVGERSLFIEAVGDFVAGHDLVVHLPEQVGYSAESVRLRIAIHPRHRLTLLDADDGGIEALVLHVHGGAARVGEPSAGAESARSPQRGLALCSNTFLARLSTGTGQELGPNRHTYGGGRVTLTSGVDKKHRGRADRSFDPAPRRQRRSRGRRNITSSKPLDDGPGGRRRRFGPRFPRT